ncbi:PLP-dependent transferase [Schizopora paradoxa]|uniref:PLP-dependent transferase n=1 Tax=Schizopora paradoxa TaxID=27342 RepID=A0A0H2RF61_9AGAM|nr:PLP-dependent transferase [Schizopora paradoxa]
MKAIWKKAYGIPNVISLANGDPHHSLYPISQIDFTVPSLSSDNPVGDWRTGVDQSKILSSYKDKPCALNLGIALHYGAGAGLLEVREILQNMNQLVHNPPHTDVILTLGNADGLTKCFRLLGNPGDSFLAEEFSFPGMTNAPLAQGINWVPVGMDREGIIPERLEYILKSWDEANQGCRPHVLYTIPSGQNPTGGTLSLGRRQEIYRIACQYDIIILEDDPYYFLQYDRTQDSPERNSDASMANGVDNPFARSFIKGLTPSFLSMDVEGRVLRIDSFSKIIVPGMRLGWITCNAFFSRKLEILTDSSTQHPHGFGQALIAEMLGPQGWGFDGYFRWIDSLCADYQRRRDLFIDIFNREMKGKPYASVDKPSAGMFMWIEVVFHLHPRFVDEESNAALNEELFERIFESGVVVMPAKTFAVGSGSKTGNQATKKVNYLRATFAGTDDQICNGVVIVCKVIRDFFK